MFTNKSILSLCIIVLTAISWTPAAEPNGIKPSIVSFVSQHDSASLPTVTTDVPTTLVVEYGTHPEQLTHTAKNATPVNIHALSPAEPLLAGATYFYRYTVTDTFGRSVTSDVLAATVDSPENKAPRIAPLAPVIITAGDAIRLPVFVTADAKTTLPKVLADHLTDWMMLEQNPTHTLAAPDPNGHSWLHIWTDTTTPSGIYRVLITAIDEQNAFDQKLVTVVVRRPTDPPRILSVEFGQTTSNTLTLRVTTDSLATADVAFGAGDKLDRKQPITTSPRYIHIATLESLQRASDYHCLVTVQNGGHLYRRAVKGTTLAQPETVIDLDSTISTPYLLSKHGATYRLQSDIVARRTAFVVGADNITLDLQGYTITYAAGPPQTPVVVNPSFEEPLTQGWDTRAAPNAFRDDKPIRLPTKKNEATCASGKASLGWKLPLAAATESILSDQIVLTGGYTYSLSMRVYDWISGWRDTDPIACVRIELVDAMTLQPIRVTNNSSDTTERPAMAECRKATELGAFFWGDVFRLKNDATVRIRISVQPTDPKLTGTIHIDDVSLVVANYYGVAFGTVWDDPFYPDSPRTKSLPSRFRIKNGNVMQSPNAGFNGDAIVFTSNPRSFSSVESITSRVCGINSQNFCGGGGDYLHHNTFDDTTLAVSSRHQQEGGNVHLKNNTGRNLVELNTIRGGCQYGVNISGDGDTNEIVENAISNNAVITQGYNIGVSSQAALIHHNTIQTENGNGIMVSGWNNTIADNSVSIQSLPNQEYGFQQACKAVELRMAGNTLLARNTIHALMTDNSIDAHALTFRECLSGNRIEGNEIVAESRSPNRRGAAMRFYCDASCNAIIYDNQFVSNTLMMMVDDGCSGGATFWRNVWTPSETKKDVVTAGWYCDDPTNLGMQLGRFFDNVIGDNKPLHWERAAIGSNAAEVVSFESGRSTPVRVVDGKNQPIAGAEVMVVNAAGTPSLSGITGDDGFMRVIASRDSIYYCGEARSFLFVADARWQWRESGTGQTPTRTPVATPKLSVTRNGWQSQTIPWKPVNGEIVVVMLPAP
ncbi:MAG: hypothetical protein ACRC46_09560 [Thermoguttaceae bacterium]